MNWVDCYIQCRDPLCPWLSQLPAPIKSPRQSLSLNQWLVRIDDENIESSLEEENTWPLIPNNAFSQCCRTVIHHPDQTGIAALFARFALVTGQSSSIHAQLITPEKTCSCLLTDDMSADRIEALFSLTSLTDQTVLLENMARDVPFIRIYLEQQIGDVIAPFHSSRVLMGNGYAIEGIELTISPCDNASHSLLLATSQHLSEYAGYMLLTRFISGMEDQEKWAGSSWVNQMKQR